jgi:hypothetical protein
LGIPLDAVSAAVVVAAVLDASADGSDLQDARNNTTSNKLVKPDLNILIVDYELVIVLSAYEFYR